MKGKKDGKDPGESGSSFEQLGRMAAQQAAIKKQLQEMAQELNKDGSGKGNGLKDLIKKIEETEDEIINNDISLSTIERQEEIKVKLLELDKATKEQEEEAVHMVMFIVLFVSQQAQCLTLQVTRANQT